MFAERAYMTQQIHQHGVSNKAVLNAMNEVPRHCFLPDKMRSLAYMDSALPIGQGQTISQPFMVAHMAEQAQLKPSDKVLDIGTGCGYAAAVFATIVSSGRVCSVGIIPELAEGATNTLKDLGFDNVKVFLSDGSVGLPDESPFDAIIVAASAHHVPLHLKEQLSIGGRLIIPVYDSIEGFDKLKRVTRLTERDFSEDVLTAVRFVPLTGEQGWNGYGAKPSDWP